MNPGSPLKIRTPILTTLRHDRDAIGFKYVYPVVSRRAKGLSIGINLNPNNACNWRCVYCQVEGLERGSAPRVDLEQLRVETLALCDAIDSGAFLEQHVPSEYRRVADVAISGNGEPTSAPQFRDVIELLAQLREERPLLQDLPTVLITNGSLADRSSVQDALARLAQICGTVWFKLDAGTNDGIERTNSATTTVARHLARLSIVAHLCPTYVQSCWFQRDHQLPNQLEIDKYLEALRDIRLKSVPIRGVQLYTLARQSLQPEAPTLSPVPSEWLEQLAQAIMLLGLKVDVAP